MYICSICGLNSKPNEPITLEVIETREKSYYTLCLRREIPRKKRRNSLSDSKRFEYKYFYEPNPEKVKELTKDPPKKLRWIVVSEKTSFGKEIAKEQPVCKNCTKYVVAS